jgi:hypothetical protein
VDDWRTIPESARVHRQLRKHSRYVAMVFGPSAERTQSTVAEAFSGSHLTVQA